MKVLTQRVHVNNDSGKNIFFTRIIFVRVGVFFEAEVVFLGLFLSYKPPGHFHAPCRESASCAHTFGGTSQERDGHFLLECSRSPSHSSPIPDMLIPAVVASRHGGDRLAVSVSRCAHAARLCQKTAIREGLERTQLLLVGDLGEGDIERGPV